jgi:hypothetical protein
MPFAQMVNAEPIQKPSGSRLLNKPSASKLRNPPEVASAIVRR